MVALVDTNVVLDLLGKREPWYHEASDLLFLAAQGKTHLALSASTITDLYYLIHKHVYQESSKCRDIIMKLLDFFSIIEVGYADCCIALTSPLADYEDAVLSEAAKRAKVACIITRNGRDFQKSTLPVYTPKEYLESLLAKQADSKQV